MIFIVPTIGGEEWPSYKQRTVLDGVEFVFRVQWNGSAEAWYLTLCDLDEEPIATCKLTVGLELFKRVVPSRRWPGRLFCVSMSESGIDPTFDSLGVDHKLVYFDGDENPTIEVETVSTPSG